MPFSETSSVWYRSPWGLPAVVLVVGLLLTGAEARTIWRDARAADRRRFDMACESMWERLEDQIEAYQHALERIQEFSECRWPLDQGKWDAFVWTLNPEVQYPAVVDLRFVAMTPWRWARVVEVSRHPPIRVKLEGLREPATVLPPGPGTLFHWGNHEWVARSECPSGLPDWETDIVMARAAVNGLARVSRPRVIGIDRRGQRVRGFTFAVPAYAPDLVGQSQLRYRAFEQASYIDAAVGRINRILGVALASVSVDRLMDGIFGSGPQEICLELLDLDQEHAPLPLVQFPPEWVTVWGKADEGLPWKPLFQAESVHPHYTRRLLARFHSTPLFELHSTASRAWTVLWMGGGLSVTVAGMLAAQMQGRRRALRLAQSLEESRQLLGRASELQSRISRDLHDGTVQSLFAIELGLSRAARRLAGTNEARMIADAIREMDAMIADLRGFLVELDPEISPGQPASTALAVLADRLRKATASEVQFTAEPGADAGLDQRDVVNLLQVAREGASNALRHGGATRVTIRLSRAGRHRRLTVSDNGTGFHPADGAFLIGGGLTNLKQRAESLGGGISVDSRPGGPTHLHFDFKPYE